ncbi:MAG: carboxypeptidase-like regulatory domain-containing protein, partial [Muribaculaceae bacterium]|nr:carboxypeptidase-like regulatory domain-containing protein [Muribaculaceae bacterium]
MRNLLLISLILFSFFALPARNIQGRVLASNDSTSLQGAACKLLSGNKLISETKTDADGLFSIENAADSELYLEVSLKNFASTTVFIKAGSKNVDLGKIFLDEITNLNEVVVTADAVSYSKGRTIIYPSIADVKASSSAISLFQKLPLAGLEANPINRSLSVDGGAPMILIDGVPSTLDDFNSINPKDIAKIEYSRLTPARYADKGTNGVIIIQLKKRDDGGQIYAWGRSAVNTVLVDANIRASYHQGSSQFSLFYTPSWRNYGKVYDNITESYIGDDFRVNLEEHDRNPFNYVNHAMRLKYDFRPTEKTLFSATFRAVPFKNKNRTIAHTIDSELGEYDNNNLSTSNSFSPSLDLFLRQDFNKKNSLEVQVVG